MSLLRTALKSGNTSSVESILSILSKTELNAEFNMLTDNKTILMLAIEAKNPQILELVLNTIPEDLIRVQLESTNPQKSLIELSLDNLAGDSLTMVLDKLRKYPDMLQKQINSKNILINALKRNQEHALMQTIELLKPHRAIFKRKVHELSPDSLKQLIDQINEIINFGPMDENKLKLLDSLSRDIMCSTKFNDDIKIKLLDLVSIAQAKIEPLIKGNDNTFIQKLSQDIDETKAVAKITQAVDSLSKQTSQTMDKTNNLLH
jgi:hypothetical protein